MKLKRNRLDCSANAYWTQAATSAQLALQVFLNTIRPKLKVRILGAGLRPLPGGPASALSLISGPEEQFSCSEHAHRQVHEIQELLQHLRHDGEIPLGQVSSHSSHVGLRDRKARERVHEQCCGASVRVFAPLTWLPWHRQPSSRAV